LPSKEDLFIDINAFDYPLAESQIAQFALEPRDSSKLLIYQVNDQSIKEDVFRNLTENVPENASFYFNNAKVIPARIFLTTSTGAKIEVFLLKPFDKDYQQAMSALHSIKWECMIGNKKKWKESEVLTLNLNNNLVHFELIEETIVEIKWFFELPFVSLLTEIGKIPLPPYIKRLSNEHDETRYQTVYSKIEGSVAAPTAGLHFTESVLESIDKRTQGKRELTLHVGAGTFLPVKVQNAIEHTMHEEHFSVEISTIKQLLNDDYVIAVGTTSVRVLESLYWCGVNVINKTQNPFCIDQFAAFNEGDKIMPDYKTVLSSLVQFLEAENKAQLIGITSIMIFPGYDFKIVRGLVTNFHQPKSTLILLISAFVNQNWKGIYQYALENEFRFLSYGDSSILLR
jgi:S-adenosylmethionine:tRNA ribosyltransferase-isomerase